MIRWSVIASLAGVLGTWGLMTRLARGAPHRAPEQYWLLGLVALSPAWLIAFLALLTRMAGRFPERPLAVSWVLSSAAAVLGVIIGDRIAQALRESEKPYPPGKYWLLGVVTLFPAWGIALLGLLWAAPSHRP